MEGIQVKSRNKRFYIRTFIMPRPLFENLCTLTNAVSKEKHEKRKQLRLLETPSYA